jgi:hypothetical protein
VAFLNRRSGLSEIQGVHPELTVIGTGEIDSHTIAMHHAANVGRNLPQNLAQVEIRYDAIGKIKQQFQALLRPLGCLKIDGIVSSQCNLACYQRTESNFIG